MLAMNRIYQKIVLTVGATCTLDKGSSQHLLKVLRMRIGEKLLVFSGAGGYYSSKLVSAANGVAQLQVLEFFDVLNEPPVYVHLGQCLSRGERMDYAIQKSVEVGVGEITPLFSERSNVKLPEERIEKRMQHWQKVIISACEQSGRTVLPILHRPMKIEQWIAQCEGVSFICDFKPDGLVEGTFDKANILIGPEGGLDANEIQLAHESGFHSLFLGNLTLRTETAPVVAISKLQFKFI
jgi:16S rRNA (uracil1498-N3)-methyltransferase